jgi:CheY-like chemotaxis protein
VELPAVNASVNRNSPTYPRTRIGCLAQDPEIKECLREIFAASSFEAVWLESPDAGAGSGLAAILVDRAAYPHVTPKGGYPPLMDRPATGIISPRTVLDPFGSALSVVSGASASAEDAPLGLNLLVAEDNLINQRVIAAMLNRLGCRSAFAENGADAVELARAGPFDGVLMDVNMPLMDGIEAARRIREFSPDLPIVALSAAAEFHSDADACRRAGMDQFLSKPVDMKALKGTLAEFRRPDSSAYSQRT